MIQCGALKGLPPDARKVFQSARLCGEKILVPSGQLFFSPVFFTVKQFVHFRTAPAEYEPFNFSFAHLQLLGLPFFGSVLTCTLQGGCVDVYLGLSAPLADWQ
jgi:hypothetical protein